MPAGTEATLFAEWKSYEARVVPLLASDVQREETMRAFYAGAWSILCAVAIATDRGVGEALLDDLRQECRDFSARVRRMGA